MISSGRFDDRKGVVVGPRLRTRMMRIYADHVSTRMTRMRRIFADFFGAEVRCANGLTWEVARE